MKKYFKLFACCIPVRGFSVSIICDLQRTTFHYIPNQLYLILQNKEIDIEELLKSYSDDERVTLKEYFQFFIDEEYGMLTDTPDSFPEIDTNYMTPQTINNAIVDFSAKSRHDFDKIFQSLNSLGCKHLELRFFDDYPLDKLINDILPNFRDTKIRGVVLYLKYREDLTEEFLYKEIKQKYPVILDIIIHSSPIIKKGDEVNYRNLLYISDVISSEKHCGIIGVEYFSINSSTFNESLNYNSCLNKKLAIDSKGFVKNCPSMKTHFGSHKIIDINTIVSTENFQKLWKINKDSIDTCKDCQFRYICTDCRAYREDPDNIFSKPLKCGYSPYTNKWEEWSANPIKQKAIEHYEMEELIKKY